MRKSVYTGVFACTLVFALGSTKVEAAPTNTIEIKEAGVQIELLPVKEDEVPFVEEILNDVAGEAATENENSKQEPITHTIAESDTLSKIADQYKTTWKRIFDKNPQIENPNIINPGETIVIPDVHEELVARELPTIPQPTVRESSTVQSASTIPSQAATVSRGSSSGNGYVAGYCTWYVKNRRPDLPNNLGNAYSWYSRAAAQGIAVGTTPRVGAAGQRGNHVVYVESVNSDGTVTISEMNHKGLYVQTTRTLPADYFVYIY